MNEEIMTTAEEVTTEVIEASSSKSIKVLGIVGGVLLVGGLAYKFGVKPAIKKINEARAAKKLKFAEAVTIEEVVETTEE